MLTAFRKQNWKILLGCFFVSLNPLQVQIKPIYEIIFYSPDAMFQSPIGTNKTEYVVGFFIPFVARFNPLQVQTKRIEKSFKHLYPRAVSIPYRYKQNSTRVLKSEEVSKSFNPLQVQTKQYLFLMHFLLVWCFNPLQVQTKQIEGVDKEWALGACFNPLQVQTKQELKEADVFVI